MNTIDRRSPVYRQLEAYEESWKHDHAEALACRDWEDAIAIGVNIFHMLREREESWREQVFRGVVPFSADDDRDHQLRYADWLDTTRPVLTDILPELEKRFGTVEGAAKLRECVGLAEQLVKQWQPPRLSMAVGLREQTLTPEAAAELHRILYESPPPPVIADPPLREMSAEEFNRLFPKSTEQGRS